MGSPSRNVQYPPSPSVRRPAQPPPASQSIFAYTLLREIGNAPATAAPRAERRRRSPAGELPMGGGHRPSVQQHPGHSPGHGTESDVRRTAVDGIVDTGAVTLMLPQNVVRAPRPRATGHGVRRLRRRASGRAAPGRSRLGRDRVPHDGHRVHRRPTAERAADRPGRGRAPRPDRRLRQPYGDAAASGLPALQAQVTTRTPERK